MNRRSYLAAIGGTTLVGLAGCLSSVTDGSGGSTDAGGGGSDPSDATTATTTTPGGTTTPAFADVELPVPRSAMVRAAKKDAIPAITDPAFGPSWEGISLTVVDPTTNLEVTIRPRLAPEDGVIGVERDGEARAYPLRLLDWHEAVNDEFGGPLLVTFCPLCGSGITGERLVDGEPTTFGVSGLLWRNDLVLYDARTESLWSQILATAIRGPRTGASVPLVPSTLTSWGEWREEHPDTRVLLPPPDSRTVGGAIRYDYTSDPYGRYRDGDRVGIGRESGGDGDGRLHPKTRVLGVVAGGEARAYPLPVVDEREVVNDVVGGRPVVVTVGPGSVEDRGTSMVAYDRRVGGDTFSFVPDGPAHMRAGGSRWRRLTGKAVDGPRRGTRLERAAERSSMFWFAWRDFQPGTDVYGGSD